MDSYQGHNSRDCGYCGSGDCCDRQRQTALHSHPNRAELSRVQHVEFSLATSTSTTTTDFAFDCPSSVAISCDLVLVRPRPPLCAGAYFWICTTDVSKHSFRRRSLSYGLQSSTYSTSSSEADDSQTDSLSESDEYSSIPNESPSAPARAVRRTSHPSTSTSS
jgi:hypothetical protein